MKKGIYLYFSGGFDSTYTLLQLIDYISKNNSEQDVEINLINVSGSILGPKSQREQNAINNILKYINDRYNQIQLNLSKYEINMCFNRGALLVQPQIWLSTIGICVNLNYYDEIRVMFGYIVGDQALSFQREIEEIITDSIIIGNPNYSSDEIKGCIYVEFPNKIIWKMEIIKYIIENHKELMNYITTCENYKDEKDYCGNCIPCKALKSSLIEILMDDKTKESTKEYCKSFLKEKFNIDFSFKNTSLMDVTIMKCKSDEKEANDYNKNARIYPCELVQAEIGKIYENDILSFSSKVNISLLHSLKDVKLDKRCNEDISDILKAHEYGNSENQNIVFRPLDQTLLQSFSKTVNNCFNCIDNSDVVVAIYNKSRDNRFGESVTYEIEYAIRKGKPVVVLEYSDENDIKYVRFIEIINQGKE